MNPPVWIELTMVAPDKTASDKGPALTPILQSHR